ncbi:hypothetical protein HHI36_009260 [Cryptolaemus montrouzieri]|uniref:Uncharacterized protein n=1 Tax=Cryptolaemus montrouzieri TaxID=559131 RepID=A0ABD2MUX1_9CUCU
MNFTQNLQFRHPFLRMSEKELGRTESTPFMEDSTLNSALSTTVDYAMKLKIDNQFSSIEETNDVWYPVLFNTNSSLYFGSDEITENFNINVYNESNNSNYSDAFYDDETFRMATMIGIAILFGFIILATIIALIIQGTLDGSSDIKRRIMDHFDEIASSEGLFLLTY